MATKAQRQPGERGDTVLFICGAEHNAPRSVCAPGDVHAGIVADVLNRDEATGAPRYVLLALLVPELPGVQWVTARWAPRKPGSDEVTRVSRGAPPAESATPPADGYQRAQVFYVLDFPLGSWHGLDE